MNAEISKAHMRTLVDWARVYAREGDEGGSEVAFLMRRASRVIAKMIDVDPLVAEEPPEKEPDADTMRPDTDDVA